MLMLMLMLMLMQRGLVSHLLEMETDWLCYCCSCCWIWERIMESCRFDMMEIMLSRLEDEPNERERWLPIWKTMSRKVTRILLFSRFQEICSKDLEHWAFLQPGGDTLNLEIKVRTISIFEAFLIKSHIKSIDWKKLTRSSWRSKCTWRRRATQDTCSNTPLHQVG